VFEPPAIFSPGIWRILQQQGSVSLQDQMRDGTTSLVFWPFGGAVEVLLGGGTVL